MWLWVLAAFTVAFVRSAEEVGAPAGVSVSTIEGVLAVWSIAVAPVSQAAFARRIGARVGKLA